ncbi:MAG: DUF2829 domain-containing protein [Vogesella sp.]|uniref:DUF2829 domain-containing protein n=1 Tax=Vogesella sp. TaxID=1904252 RepID=UPI003F2EF217
MTYIAYLLAIAICCFALWLLLVPKEKALLALIDGDFGKEHFMKNEVWGLSITVIMLAVATAINVAVVTMASSLALCLFILSELIFVCGAMRVTRLYVMANSNDPSRAGHISWSPKAQADATYRPASGMPFGLAIEAMKQGKRVARTGWNGQGMFAYLVPAASYPAQTGVAKQFFGEGALVPYCAYMALKTAQGDVATWAPSGSDALADDWMILD